MASIICKKCGKTDEHHAKGLCDHCYHAQWTPPLITCQLCKKKKLHHAKGYCEYCYNKTFHKEYYRFMSRKQYSGISEDLFKNLPKACIICGFDKIVEFHHIIPNANGGQTSLANIAVLCPNHHKMLHHSDYKEEILKELKKHLT
jgi:hypothetical protein